jgi:ABC-type Na+ transport system ATPase subunit NatA
VAHSQAVLLSLWRRLDLGHPVAYPDGGVDMVGLDEAGNAYARVARERALEAVAWLVEAGEERVKARHEELRQALCLLRCANHQPKEESQTRRARE